MKPQSLFIVACFATALLMSTSPSALAAKSPAMQACSAQWADMKKAGKTEGQTWPKFWSQCSKDYAAKNEGGATEPEKTTKSSKRLPLPPLMRAIPQDQVSKRRIVMQSGVPTRRRAVPMVGMIISNSWPNACEYDAAIGRTECQMIDASADRRTGGQSRLVKLTR